jgi:shikimate kinase
MKKIILLGYMGSGKSQTAAELSRQTNYKWLDLDTLIEENAQMPIGEIFQKHGEIRFRKLEHDLLRELMQNDESFILSFGGGTPCYANNHEFLKSENTISFYLKTSIDELYKRLLREKNHRPLIAHMEAEEMKEFIAKSLFERSYYYNMASVIINTDEKSIESVAHEIKKHLV